MQFIPLAVERRIAVRELYSLHYFRYLKGFAFPGETHDFWELVYADMGAVTCLEGEEHIVLSPGQCRLHAPNVFHAVHSDLAPQANVFIISFGSTSEVLRGLAGRTHSLGTESRRCISRIISEGQRCFGPVMDITYQTELKPLSTAPEAGVQLIALELERLLLLLLRGTEREQQLRVLPGDDASDRSVQAVAEAYMREHLDGSARIETISRAAGVSPTTLKRIFRENLGKAVMEEYRELRLKEACRRLRTGSVNISQVAWELGYSSVPAFTRQFRSVLGITPGQYMLLVNDEAQNGSRKQQP